MWNSTAEELGQRQRVFCASMADVFEKRKELDSSRDRLWTLIGATPWLDWLLLTKRPQHVLSLVPWANSWPSNVWLGATVENEKWAAERLPFLIDCPAIVRFVSCEPLLGRIDLQPWISSIHWVIAGGESGGRARPSHPAWFRQLRNDCEDAGVPFLFKQWGNWSPARSGGSDNVAVRDPATEVALMTRSSKRAAGRRLDGSTWDAVPDLSDRQSLAA